jgi:hypothetical protein
MTRSTRHFVRHYLEMVAAMFLGMGVLAAALPAVGVSWSELRTDAPALLLFAMGVSMTVPMVAWMRYRGHGWPASAEMAASMLIPTAAVIALLWGGVVTDVGTLLAVEHVAMAPSMLVAMLLRRHEYTGALSPSARPVRL